MNMRSNFSYPWVDQYRDGVSAAQDQYFTEPNDNKLDASYATFIIIHESVSNTTVETLNIYDNVREFNHLFSVFS